MSFSSRKRVLVSAYACSPYRGSEAGVGWGFVSNLCERYDLDVIVEEEKFRSDIETWLSENPSHPAASIRFHFIRKQRNRRLRRIWPPSYYWYYRLWHVAAAELAKRLDRERNFDLFHQLTMVGFREPGYLWTIGKPFVWGPIGGAGNFPWRFLATVGPKGGVYYFAYNLINTWQLRFARRPRRAAQRAGSGLIVATRENHEAVRHYWGCDSTILSEIGLSGLGAGQITVRSSEQPLRIYWSGQFIPGKALGIALQALADLPDELDWEFHILGDGKGAGRMKTLARELGIGTRCRFHGWLERKDALALYSTMHLCLITSLRDLTSTVVIEALEMGVPVIAPSHCGFIDAVTPDCGILVPVKTPKQLRAGIANAVQVIACDEARRRQMAKNAVARARAYDWRLKAARMAEVYETRLLDLR